MLIRRTLTAAACIVPVLTSCARAQGSDPGFGPVAAGEASGGDSKLPGARAATYTFRSRADSLEWARARSTATRADGFRVVVSTQDRRLWTIVDSDTLLSAPVAVAKGTTLTYEGRSWTFTTPRGMRRVLRKEADPVWVPPDWMYVQAAKDHGLKVGRIPNAGVRLSDGRRLTARRGVIGLVTDFGFEPLPTDEHIVFDGTLFIPPIGTENRRVEGELGKYRLDLGEGYLLHGTPHKSSIGLAATHGCIRLRDADIEWLYENVPVGTRVYIY